MRSKANKSNESNNKNVQEYKVTQRQNFSMKIQVINLILYIDAGSYLVKYKSNHSMQKNILIRKFNHGSPLTSLHHNLACKILHSFNALH